MSTTDDEQRYDPAFVVMLQELNPDEPTWSAVVLARHAWLRGFHRQGPVTDEQADAASLAFHEFVFGPQVPMSERARGITRQAWKAALEAARNA